MLGEPRVHPSSEDASSMRAERLAAERLGGDLGEGERACWCSDRVRMLRISFRNAIKNRRAPRCWSGDFGKDSGLASRMVDRRAAAGEAEPAGCKHTRSGPSGLCSAVSAARLSGHPVLFLAGCIPWNAESSPAALVPCIASTLLSSYQKECLHFLLEFQNKTHHRTHTLLIYGTL